MGDGEHTGGQGRDLLSFMAPEKPWPARGTQEWAWRVVMEGELPGRLFMLAYLQSVREADEGFDTVPDNPELTRLLADAKLATAGWDYQAAQELQELRPSDAPHAVEAILKETQSWRRAAGYQGMLSEIRPAMEALLDALVPPNLRADVQAAFEVVVAGPDVPLDRVDLRIHGTSGPQPYEAVHLAGAYAGALFQQRSCVPDWEATFRQLAVATDKLARQDFSDSPSSKSSVPPPQTSAPTAHRADAKRKAARKAQQKARKRGRR